VPDPVLPTLPARAAGDAAYWLGQAGFWLDMGGTRLLIDPYLSNSLAEKYAGTRFPHIRMMAVPVAPQDLPRPDIVLITHAHTDHMDAATLSPLRARWPETRFVVPAAEMEQARARIGRSAQLEPVQAGDVIALGAGSITVFPAAHETRRQDAVGRDHFLGYGIALAGKRLYHSGDTIPFAGLSALLTDFAPDIALLPINGRDAARAAHGVPGNMTLDEALTLCTACRIPVLVPHHFGLFAFNTASASDLARALAHQGRPKIEVPSPLQPIPLASPKADPVLRREQN